MVVEARGEPNYQAGDPTRRVTFRCDVLSARRVLCRRVEVRCAGADHRDSEPLISALNDTPCHPPAEQTGLQSLRNTKMKIRIICAVALLCRVLLSRGGNSGNGTDGADIPAPSIGTFRTASSAHRPPPESVWPGIEDSDDEDIPSIEIKVVNQDYDREEKEEVPWSWLDNIGQLSKTTNSRSWDFGVFSGMGGVPLLAPTTATTK